MVWTFGTWNKTLQTVGRFTLTRQQKLNQMTQVLLKIKTVFPFFFPDGTMTDGFGGASSACDFNKIVHQVQSQGFDRQVVSKMSGEFTQDFIGDNLAESCLLQFPFGRGGMNEICVNGEEDVNSGFDLMDFVDIMDISQLQFQTPLCVLKLFNARL